MVLIKKRVQKRIPICGSIWIWISITTEYENDSQFVCCLDQMNNDHLFICEEAEEQTSSEGPRTVVQIISLSFVKFGRWWPARTRPRDCNKVIVYSWLSDRTPYIIINDWQYLTEKSPVSCLYFSVCCCCCWLFPSFRCPGDKTRRDGIESDQVPKAQDKNERTGAAGDGGE